MSVRTIENLKVANEGETQAPVKQSRVAERVTVNLTERSAAALASLATLTGDTKTEAINKALQVYAVLQAAQSHGGEVQLKETADDSLTKVRFY